MVLVRYVIGTAALLVALAAVVRGVRSIREHLLPDWTGPLGWLVVTVLGLSLVTVVSEVLGTVGLLRIVPLTVVLIGLGLAARRVAGSRSAPRREPTVSQRSAPGALPPTADAWARRIAAAAVLVVGAEWLTATVRSFQVGMSAVDATWYHMPTAARFAQSGSTWRLHLIDTSSLTVFYPAGSELLHAVGMAFLHTDALSRVLNLGWLMLGFLAAWCIGARYGVAPLTLLGAALLFATPQLVSLEAGQALNDVAVTALLLAAAAVIVNAVVFEKEWSISPAPLAIAGLAAGLAVGTKWTALVAVAALTVGIPFLSRRTDRVRNAALWLGVIAMSGGYWYLRNLVAVGSPVPPQRIGLGPVQLPYVAPGIPTFSITRHLTESDTWHHVILPGLRASFGPVWWLVLIFAAGGLVAGIALIRDRSVQLAAVAGIACVMSYVLTKQGFTLAFWKGTPRYAAPGLALGLVILPVALSRASRLALLLTLPAYAAMLTATQFDSRLWRPWWPPSHHLAVVAVVTLALLAGIATGVGASRHTRLELRPALPIGIAVLVVLSLASGFALKGYRQTFADHGTQGERAASFLRARHVRHARIALTGSLLVSGSQYAFYDKRLTNYVQFIAQRVADHRVAPFTRCASFVQAVDAGRYDYVVAPVASASVGGPATWLESNRTARRLDHGGLAGAAVFEITGRLDPARCGQNR